LCLVGRQPEETRVEAIHVAEQSTGEYEAPFGRAVDVELARTEEGDALARRPQIAPELVDRVSSRESARHADYRNPVIGPRRRNIVCWFRNGVDGLQRTRKCPNRRVFEEACNANLVAADWIQATDDARRAKRITAEGEEGIGDANGLNLEHLGPDLRNLLLEGCYGRHVVIGQLGSVSWRGW
jgi:hypothetical protein